ncbi:hypothetical protein QFZ89_007793 [Paraburkholderia youngii]
MGDCESEGSPRQSAGLTNRKRIRGDALGQDSEKGQSPKLARDDAHRVGKPSAAHGAREDAAEAGARTKYGPHHRHTESGAARMGELLPVHAGQARVGRAGWLAAPPVAMPALAAGEAPAGANHHATSTGVAGGAGVALRPQWPRAMVECGCTSHGRCLPQTLLRPTGAGLVAGQPSSASSILDEPPYAEPHVRLCGRAEGVIPHPTRCPGVTREV